MAIAPDADTTLTTKILMHQTGAGRFRASGPSILWGLIGDAVVSCRRAGFPAKRCIRISMV